MLHGVDGVICGNDRTPSSPSDFVRGSGDIRRRVHAIRRLSKRSLYSDEIGVRTAQDLLKVADMARGCGRSGSETRIQRFQQVSAPPKGRNDLLPTLDAVT